jgi:hypothetical protein
MITITNEQWEKISPDFKGVFANTNYPELVGKRSCFAASIGLGWKDGRSGTTLVFEGIDFTVLPKPEPQQKRRKS